MIEPSAIATSPDDAAEHVKLAARDIRFHYGDALALKGIDLEVPEHRVTALIGPSGCGKSTLLRVFNRIYELYPGQRAEGQVLLDGQDVLARNYPLAQLRSRIGMVFQKPVPFPMTIYDNVAYGISHYEKLPRAEMDALVDAALTRAEIWD